MDIVMVVVLTIIFTTLKVANLINWSWIWVVSPIWLYILFVIYFSIIYNILMHLMSKPKKTKTKSKKVKL